MSFLGLFKKNEPASRETVRNRLQFVINTRKNTNDELLQNIKKDITEVVQRYFDQMGTESIVIERTKENTIQVKINL